MLQHMWQIVGFKPLHSGSAGLQLQLAAYHIILIVTCEGLHLIYSYSPHVAMCLLLTTEHLTAEQLASSLTYL